MTVSVIVRTVGRPGLERALASVLAQDYQEVEIVLVLADPACDAGAWVEHDKLRVVAPGHALDRPAAANAGLEAASGGWIGFLDEDDWLDPNHVSRLLERAANAPNCLLVYGDTMIHGPAEKVTRGLGYWRQCLTDSPTMPNCAMLVARALIERHGCRFDPEFVLLEDWDFIVQCAEFTDFLHVPGVTSHYDGVAGTSGGGVGPNRDDERIRPYVERMTAKWGERYGEIRARAEELVREAGVAIGEGRIEDALSVLNAGLQLDPGNPMLLNRYAVCLRRNGDVQGALMALRRACDSDRHAASLLGDRIVLEHDLGFTEIARECFLALVKLVATEQEWARAKAIARYIGAEVSVGPAVGVH